MAVHQLFVECRGLAALHERFNCCCKGPAVVDNATPYLPGFPGAVVRTVVFEPEVKRHSDTDDTDRLPRQGNIKFKKIVKGSDGGGVKKAIDKRRFRPVEGHPKAVVAFDEHGFRLFVNGKANNSRGNTWFA